MTGTGAERKEERDFLDWLQCWKQGLPALSLADVLQENGGPEQAAVLCVDMVNGFAHEGPLASPRVRAIIPAVTALFQRAYQHGIRRFILPQDNHPPDSPEFGCWPAHCVAGTAESETIPELTGLAFSSLYRVVPKRSISSGIGTDLEDALGPEPLQVAICAGDCTDLCLYQLAMHLRLRPMRRVRVCASSCPRTACRPTICPSPWRPASERCPIPATCYTTCSCIIWR